MNFAIRYIFFKTKTLNCKLVRTLEQHIKTKISPLYHRFSIELRFLTVVYSFRVNGNRKSSDYGDFECSYLVLTRQFESGQNGVNCIDFRAYGV